MNNTSYTSQRANDPNIFSSPNTSNSWTIFTINTQVLMEDSNTNLWFTYLSQSPIDICTHTETNGKNHMTKKWHIPGYTSWWSNNKSQKIGNGIGISIRKHIAEHVYKSQT